MTADTAPVVQWEVLRRLDDADVNEVGILVEQVTEADGIRPLSEHVMLHLRHGGDVDVRHVLARSAVLVFSRLEGPAS